MVKFAAQCLDGIYRMAYMPQKEYASCAIEFNTMAALEEHDCSIIPATVPGNSELDLQAAGLIDEPFYGSNIIELQKYENYHVFYSKTFDYTPNGSDPQLYFEGIDTFADIYLNGVLLGHTENMLIPHQMRATSTVEGENELFVHIYPTCIKARKHDLGAADNAMRYTYDSLLVRKAAHMFGWDIMPRAVSAGLWRSVSLLSVPNHYVREAYLMTNRLSADQDRAYCELFYRFEIGDDPIKGYSFTLTADCGESHVQVSDVLWFTQGKLRFEIENPKLWWPVGRGDQNLYTVTITLLFEGAPVASDTFRTGIRTTKLRRSEILNENGEGEFCFVINGERIFIKGSNWVPADAYHSRDRERIPAMLDLWTEIGCNALRSWGGGVYEDDLFYDICDEKGIIVWADFAMGCGSYPQTENMQKALYHEAEVIIKKLRHHPSICLWAGDNENDYFMAYNYGTDPNLNLLTRKVLPEAIRRHDPIRPFLPSSPYVSPAAWTAHDSKLLPENHLWGPRDYFKSDFYRQASALFASEMGYHGCPSPRSVRRFLPPESVWTDYCDNADWLTHAASPDLDGPYAYRNELMRKHVKTLWGIDHCESLDQFARASQISQAEAKKYFIERFRAKKWHRTGVIWWNIIDGWPQFSDAVVDYYFTKKLAFSYIKRSQNPLCFMMDEPQDEELPLVTSNDTRFDQDTTYHVFTLEDGAKHLVDSGRVCVRADSAQCVSRLPYDGLAQTFYYIEWDNDQYAGNNHFLAGRPPYDLVWYFDIIRRLGYDQFEGF